MRCSPCRYLFAKVWNVGNRRSSENQTFHLEIHSAESVCNDGQKVAKLALHQWLLDVTFHLKDESPGVNDSRYGVGFKQRGLQDRDGFGFPHKCLLPGARR